jgi:hypothetical protein
MLSRMSVLDGVRAPFRAVAVAVVPEAAALDDAGWRELEGIVENALRTRPVRLVRQVRFFIRLLDLSARLRYGAPLSRLDVQRRTALLQRFEDAPVLLLRRGFWGLRTLVFMGYYARPAGATEIGYRAQPAGWSARR